MKYLMFAVATLCLVLSTDNWKAYGNDYGYDLAGDYSGSRIYEKLVSTAE